MAPCIGLLFVFLPQNFFNGAYLVHCQYLGHASNWCAVTCIMYRVSDKIDLGSKIEFHAIHLFYDFMSFIRLIVHMFLTVSSYTLYRFTSMYKEQ